MTMTELVPAVFFPDENGAPPVLTRAAVVDDFDVDTGIVQAKLVPYEHEAQLDEELFEVFTRGAFSGAASNTSRVIVSNQAHDRANSIGRALELRDEDDGLYGSLKISDTTHGRDVLTLMRDGVLTELSVEFRPQRRRMRVTRRADGLLVRHDKATLIGVSPVAAGAYGNEARILSVRDEQRDRERERIIAQLHSLTSGRSKPV
jgi:HK97 family phage prohead protease